MKGLGTLASIGLGATLTYFYQGIQWQNEAMHRLQTDFVNRRVEIYRDMTAALAQAQRLRVYHGSSDAKTSKTFQSILKCAEAPVGSGECSVATDDVTRDMAKDIFELHAKFEANKALARTYFCSGTNNAIERLPSGFWWFNASQNHRDAVISNMATELKCELNFGLLLNRR